MSTLYAKIERNSSQLTYRSEIRQMRFIQIQSLSFPFFIDLMMDLRREIIH